MHGVAQLLKIYMLLGEKRLMNECYGGKKRTNVKKMGVTENQDKQKGVHC